MTERHKRITASGNRNGYGAVGIRHNKAFSLLRPALK